MAVGPKEQALRSRRIERARAAGIDFEAHRHPVLAVACPACKANVGVWCQRPSGHRAMNFHAERKQAADAAWKKYELPTTTQVGPEKFVYDQPAEEKLAIIHGMLTRPEGCTTKQILESCQWPSVSVPQQARALGIKLKKEKVDGVTVYRAA